MKGRLLWRRLSREEHCCLWTWMTKSCLRLWITTSSSGITRDAWGNWKTQYLDFLRDSLGSPSIKIFVNHNHNINKYEFMICISPSSVLSFAFFIVLKNVHSRSCSLIPEPLVSFEENGGRWGEIWLHPSLFYFFCHTLLAQASWKIIIIIFFCKTFLQSFCCIYFPFKPY